jgi:hypothetical protein
MGSDMAEKSERRTRLLELLTLLSLFVGLVSTLSYSTPASMVLRAANPRFGAWWDAQQFYVMAGAATAFGLLIGIRVGRRMVNDSQARARSATAAFVLAILAFAPLVHVCEAAARLGWAARGGTIASWLIGRAGYERGTQLDRVLIASVYFFKIAGFALLGGLALIALAVAVSWATGAGSEAEASRS